MRRLLLGLLLTAGAGATTVPTLTLEQQAKKAEVIVRAKLGTATTSKEGDVTYTVYPLTISETIAGDAASLPQLEGKPALFFLQGVQDLPKIGVSPEGLLLLYTKKLESPIVGFNQGWYPIENGKVTLGTEPDPAKLRDAIRAARGTP